MFEMLFKMLEELHGCCFFFGLQFEVSFIFQFPLFTLLNIYLFIVPEFQLVCILAHDNEH